MMTRVLVIDVESELPVPPARVRVRAYTNLSLMFEQVDGSVGDAMCHMRTLRTT
jgi:hypothetical protein